MTRIDQRAFEIQRAKTTTALQRELAERIPEADIYTVDLRRACEWLVTQPDGDLSAIAPDFMPSLLLLTRRLNAIGLKA